MFQVVTPILCMIFIYILQVIIDEIVIPEVTKDFPLEPQQVPTFPMDLIISQLFTVVQGEGFPDDVLVTNVESLEYEDIDVLNLTNAMIEVVNDEGNSTGRFEEVDLILYSSLERMADDSSYEFPYIGAIKVEEYDEQSLKYVIQYEAKDGNVVNINSFSLDSRLDGKTQFCGLISLLAGGSHCEFIIAPYLMDMLNFNYMGKHTNFSRISFSFTQQMPFALDTASLVLSFSDLTQLLGRIIYPLLLLLPLPSIIYALVYEKEKKLKEMMKLMGMKEGNYQIASFIVKFASLIFSYLIFMAMGFILQHRVFIQTNFLIVCFVGIGTGLLVYSMCLFFSAVINSTYISSMFSYVFVVFAPLVGVFVNQFLLTAGRYELKWLLLIPPIPITEMIIYMFTACDSYKCFDLVSVFGNQDFILAFIMVFVDAILLFLIALYVEQISPKTWGVRKSPFYLLEPIFRFIKKKCTKVADVHEHQLLEETELEDVEMDEDVLSLKRSIQNNELQEDERGIVIKGLRKEFGKKNVAIKRLFLAIKDNECLGLLGTNGAGKTTTMRILSGIYKQTSGKVYIHGLDTSKEMDKIRYSLGFCPQFSVVWDDLTPSEHLLFYSRLKGIPLKKEKEEVQSLLVKIGFKKTTSDKKKKKNFMKSIFRFFFPDERKASQLSGGMKRRLAIGISLCGNPATILLDEPTTGLDPINKRSIWTIINTEKKNRCCVLTTHSLEEADALCDEVSILHKGEMKCFGKPLHLKHRFGNGYMLTVSFDGKIWEKNNMIEFVKTSFESFSKVSIHSSLPGIVSFQLIPKEDIMFRLSTIAKVMYEKYKAKKIAEFDITQTSLEDVFLNVVKEPKDLDEKKEVKDEENKKIVVETDEKSMSSNSVSVEKDDVEKSQIEITIKEKDNGVVTTDEKTLSINSSAIERVDLKKTVESKILSEIDGEDPALPKKTRGVCLEAIVDFFVFLREVVVQVFFLLHKNLLLSIRGWKATCVQIVSPLVVVLLLFTLSVFALFFQSSPYLIHPASTKINTESFDDCITWTGGECYKLVFTTNEDEFAERVMLEVVDAASLKENVDYKKFPDSFEMEEFMNDHPNVSMAGIGFWSVNLLLNMNVTDLIDYISRLGLGTGASLLGLDFEDLFNLTQLLDFAPVIQNFDVLGFLNLTNFQFIAEFLDPVLDQLGLNVSDLFNGEVDLPTVIAIVLSAVSSTESPIGQSILQLLNITTLPFDLTIYTIYYNGTFDLSNQYLKLKTILDSKIYQLTQRDRGVIVGNMTMDTYKQNFPQIRSRVVIDGQSTIFSLTGALFFSLSTLILFVVSLYKLVQEKEIGLKSGLTMIGMKQTGYLLSWFITFSSFGALMSVVSILAGYLFFLDPFLYSNPLFTFIMFFTFSISLVCLAFAVSPFFNKAKQALTFGFIILGISFILNLFLSNGVVAYLLMGLKDWYALIPLGFEIFYSPFNFGKIFQDILGKTVRTLDSATNTYIPNTGYWTWEDFVDDNVFSSVFGKIYGQASYRSVLFMLLNCVIYLSVFLYFENVMPNPQGISEKWYFWLDPWYWGFGKYFLKKKKINKDVAKRSKEELEGMNEDLLKEYQDIRETVSKENENSLVLRIMNLQKIYNKNSCFSKKVKALDGIDIGIRKKEVLAYLGHNGAGKSTSILQIAGIIKKGKGEIFVDGLGIPRDMVNIRKKLGVCLQHDLLWDDLTAWDHLRLVAQLKGIRSQKRLKKEITDRLNDVNLFSVRNKRTKTFSGGMKRRLSVALSFVASPQLILLDEPSSGLDPEAKRDIWKLVGDRNFSSSSSIMLTTHSLDEAERLSSRVAILQKGKILCIGSSMQLKEKYGSGYYLRFVCTKNQDHQEFEKKIVELFPHIKLLTSNAGNFIFVQPFLYFDEMIEGIKVIENEYLTGEQRIVTDFGVSNSTLEDVYITVTDDANPDE